MPKGFKHSKESKQKIIAGLVGRPVSKKTREKIGNANMGKKNGMYGKAAWNNGTKGKGICKANSGSFTTERVAGEKNCNWLGGKTKLIDSLRKNKKYIVWRNKILKRDNYICQIYGCHEEDNLEVHHIIQKASLILKYNIKTTEDALKCKELWRVDNGITLCKKCHNNIRGKESEEKYKNLFQAIIKLK